MPSARALLTLWLREGVRTSPQVLGLPPCTLSFKPIDSWFAQGWLQSHERSVLFHLAFFKTSTTGGRQSIPKPQALARCSTCLKSHDRVWYKAGWSLQRLWEVKPYFSPAPQGTKQHHLVRNSILGSSCMMLGLSKPLHYSPKKRYKSTWGKKGLTSSLSKIKREKSNEDSKAFCWRHQHRKGQHLHFSLAHRKMGAKGNLDTCCEGIVQHQEKAEKQPDFPSERMPESQVQCSTFPGPGQQLEALNLNIGRGTERALLSFKNGPGSRGFPVPLSSLCPSVLLIIIIISSKRKWAVFAKKRQNNSRRCQAKEGPPTSWWLFFNKGLFLLKGGKMCAIVKGHTCTSLTNIGIHVAYDLCSCGNFVQEKNMYH